MKAIIDGLRYDTERADPDRTVRGQVDQANEPEDANRTCGWKDDRRMSNVFLRDVDSVVDYTIDWSDCLASGESISSSSWTASPTSLTVDSSSETTTTATAVVSAGSAGVVYRLTNEITTDQARTIQRSVVIRVEER